MLLPTPRPAAHDLIRRRSSRGAQAFALALALVAGLLLTAGRAEAQGSDGGGAPSTTLVPPAPPGDGAAATRILKEVEASASTPRLAKVVAEPLRRAKAALERAHGARMSNDVAHGRMLDGLALEWAETARDLARAAAAEEAATATAQKARDMEVQVERGRALLEETQARHGRAAADLVRIEAEAAEALKKAADTEEQRLDAAGRKKPGTPGEGGAKKGEGAAKKPANAAAGKKKAPGGGARSPKRSP